ncbi:MAG: PqiC family protein [Paracoccus sp. (in: a-proteobacteria)]|nr:PqiC family protein [Paracoccus sp. (in: a-proteobacteria)]
MNRLTIITVFIAAALGLSACGDGTGVARYIIDPPPPGQHVANRLGATELKNVSLPDYAAAPEIAWQDGDGSVRANNRVIWADQPERAFTITLARAISEASGASVVAEPWPFPSPPQHRLDVRVEQALASNDGIFRLKGRYFVSAEGSGAGSHHIRSFDFAVPVDPGQPDSIARASSVAITLLAEQIAGLGGSGTTIVATMPRDPYANLAPLF